LGGGGEAGEGQGERVGGVVVVGEGEFLELVEDVLSVLVLDEREAVLCEERV
jgi:hypothetical protein